MAELQQVMMDIAASLWSVPCKLEELAKKDFLKGKSEYMVFSLLGIARSKGWIYERNDIYYCYKKTVKEVLNPNSYELDEREKLEDSDFAKAYKKAIKNL